MQISENTLRQFRDLPRVGIDDEPSKRDAVGSIAVTLDS